MSTSELTVESLLAMLERMETTHVKFRGPDGEQIHPDWCRECRVTKAQRERDEARAAIADIDAHATPVGLLNNDDPEGSPHHYLVTVGALHRALGKAYTAELCDAERERLRLDVQSLQHTCEELERQRDEAREDVGREPCAECPGGWTQVAHEHEKEGAGRVSRERLAELEAAEQMLGEFRAAHVALQVEHIALLKRAGEWSGASSQPMDGRAT